MRWLRIRRTAPGLPPEVRAALPLTKGERLLAASCSGREATGFVWLLATNHRLAAVAEDGQLGWVHPWLEVDSGVWGREASELTLTFVDRPRPLVFPMAQDAVFLQVVRERVQASVVSAQDLDLPGPGKARAALRQDLATGELIEQVVLGRGTRPSEQIDQAAADAFAQMREEAGLQPVRG